MREVIAHSLVQDVGFASTEKPRDDHPGKLYANLRVELHAGRLARSNVQSRTNFVSDSEGVSYSCIFHSRI
jgi:hypothetical protein